MKTTFYVKDPAGFTHKRCSKTRTYSHAVVYLPCYETDMSEVDMDYKVDGDNHDFNVKMVAWGGVYLGERRPWHSDEQIASDLAKYRKLASLYPDRAAAIAGQRAKRVARVEDKLRKGYYDAYILAGWCGRLDLATRLAAKTKGKSVTILKAETSA